MKLSQARIIKKDVTLLSRFYQRITGIAPVGNDTPKQRTADAKRAEKVGA
jgi:hypothetical protein